MNESVAQKVNYVEADKGIKSTKQSTGNTATDESTKISTKAYIVNSLNGLYARKTKEYGDNVAATLQHSDTLNVVDIDNEWATIIYKGETLYVCSAHLI